MIVPSFATVAELKRRTAQDKPRVRPAVVPRHLDRRDEAAQAEARADCPLLFRVGVEAARAATGESRIGVTSEWWRLSQRSCRPKGDPLLGAMTCEYAYVGAAPPDDVEPFIYGILAGL